jgi:hypothetical protein
VFLAIEREAVILPRVESDEVSSREEKKGERQAHHFIRENEEVCLLCNLPDPPQLLLVEDLWSRQRSALVSHVPLFSLLFRYTHLADRVVRGVDPDHLGFGSDGLPQLVQIDLPVLRRDVGSGSVGRRADGDEDGSAAIEVHLSDVLIEDWMRARDGSVRVRERGRRPKRTRLEENDLVAGLKEGGGEGEHACRDRGISI